MPYHPNGGSEQTCFGRRSYSTLPLRDRLVKQLMRNEELDESGARQELHWIRQEVRDMAAVASVVEKRSTGMPLQYALGNTDFGPIQLICRPPTLIPRPETAYVFENLAVRHRLAEKKGLRMLDLYTGSGAIPLLLEHLFPQAFEQILGVDVQSWAIALAKENGSHLASKTTFLQMDVVDRDFPDRILDAAGGMPFDIITANPPYISSEEYDNLPRSVKDFEDPLALTVHEDGLDHYRVISRLLPRLLKSTGLAAMEIGSGQAESVERIMQGPSRRTEIYRDQFDKDRLVVVLQG